MAQFPNLIGTYPIASGLPPGWTHNSGGPADLAIVANAETEYTDRVFTANTITNQDIENYDAPGTVTDAEALVLFKPVGTPANSADLKIVGIRGQTGTTSGYFAAIKADTGTGQHIFRVIKSVSGVISVVGTELNFAWVSNTWYWIRFRVNGTTLSAKIWAKGDAEPGSFQTSGSASNYASGNVCLVFHTNVVIPSFANLYIATAGETATRGSTLQGVAQLGLQSSFIPKAGVRFAGNSAQFDLSSLLSARFVAGPITASAVMAATSLLVTREAHPTKWQTPAALIGESSLKVNAFIPFHTKPRTYLGDHYQRRDAEDYRTAFNNLLPTGIAWPRESYTVLQKAVAGLSAIWGNTVEALAGLLLTVESDPRSTVILLPEWERAWGLPDKCVAEPLTIADRQIALVNKMTMKGAQSRQFFIDVAARIGYTNIEIREWSPFMCGISMCGDTRHLYATESLAVTKDIVKTVTTRHWSVNGKAHISTTQFKTGTSSLALDNTTQDFIWAPNSTDWILSDQSFTIDGFFYCTRAASTSYVALMGQSDAGLSSRSFALSRTPNTGPDPINVIRGEVFTNNGTQVVFGTTQITAIGWHHVRFVRYLNTLYMFIDGVLEGTTTMPAGTIVNTVSQPLAIGAFGDPGSATLNNTWGGFIDYIDFTVGVARSTTNFTPAVDPPLPPDHNSKLIMDFEDVEGSTNFVEITLFADPIGFVVPPTTTTIIAEETDNYRWEIGPPDIRFYWAVRVGARRYTWFRASSGQAGVNHHLEFGLATDLECILRRWKPAHTEIIFDYSPLANLDFSQTPDVSFMLMMF